MEVQLLGGQKPQCSLHSSDHPRSLPDMTVTLSNNLEQLFWSNGSPLRCASNNVAGGKIRPKRDFRFEVIQVRTGPKWFVWKPEAQEEDPDPIQPPPIMNHSSGSSDQENHRDGAFRRSLRLVSRRKVSNQLNTPSPVAENEQPIATEGDLCPATATNQLSTTSVSEPTTRRILAIPMDCRCSPSNLSMSLSPPSSSGHSTSSTQSSSSADSTTFQILSVAPKCESEDEDEQILECTCRRMQAKSRETGNPSRPIQTPGFEPNK